MGWRFKILWFDPLQKHKEMVSSLLKTPITVLGLQQTRIHWVRAALSSEMPGHKFDLWHLSSAEVKNEWSDTSNQYAFLTCEMIIIIISSTALVGLGLFKQMSPATSILGIRQPIFTTQVPCYIVDSVSSSWYLSAMSSLTSRFCPWYFILGNSFSSIPAKWSFYFLCIH